MHFLIDASLPRSVAIPIQQHGHQATDVRDIGLTAAADPVIAAFALSNQYCLLSRDFDFADVRNYPPSQYFGLVVFDLPPDTVAAVIVGVVDDALHRADIFDHLIGRLAIVSPGRIRVRPPITP